MQNFPGTHNFFSLTYNRLFLIWIANATISSLITIIFKSYTQYRPDSPSKEGNDDLHNRHDEPQDAHHQVENHLQEKSGIKIPTTETVSSL